MSIVVVVDFFWGMFTSIERATAAPYPGLSQPMRLTLSRGKAEAHEGIIPPKPEDME